MKGDDILLLEVTLAKTKSAKPTLPNPKHWQPKVGVGESPCTRKGLMIAFGGTYRQTKRQPSLHNALVANMDRKQSDATELQLREPYTLELSWR